MAQLNARQLGVARMLYGLARSRGLNHQRALEFAAASYAESGLNPRAVNKSSGAAGLFQLLSSGYRTRANAAGGVFNPRANANAILGDYVNYWRAHPGAPAGQAASAVERSGQGRGFYAAPLALLSGVGGGTGAATLSPPPGLSGGTPAAPAPDLGPLKQQALQALIGNIGTRTPDLSGFLGALKELRSAQTRQPPSLLGVPGGAGAPHQPGPAIPVGHLKLLGKSVSREDPTFVHNLLSALEGAGATAVRFYSTDRPRGVNAAVGGVPRSNHIPDARGRAHAVDGEALVNGRWVPLGRLLRSTAGRYHLRSGDAPGFYRGGPDLPHVDDAYNLRH